MIYRLIFLLPLLCIQIVVAAQSQDADSSEIANGRLASRYVHHVGSKAEHIDQQLDKYTAKALSKFQKQEARIRKKLERTDSLKAVEVFANSEQQYKRLQERLDKTTRLQHYIPSLDTMSSSLKFLQENKTLLTATKEGQQQLKDATARLKGMEGQFQKAEEVKKFLKERKQMLKERLGQLGFAKELKNLNKQAYYYNAQINAYKSLLKDHKKAERKALELLSKSKLFNDFMRKNSMLASFFRLPGNGPLQTSPGGGGLAGLQTRAQVTGLIQQQIAINGVGARQQFQQNMQGAQAKLNELKNKITQSGGSSSDDEMPEGFKPNPQKTKNFWRRLELGTNIQSQKANGYFPLTSDIGLSLGYRLNARSVIGVGGSYKLGLGQSIRHINLTHQGLSLRSFADWKLKGSFWLSGAYEMNFRSEFQNIDALRNLNGWQKSGLVGVSKVISLKTKFFKKTKLQLLWDVLSYQAMPKTQPVVFRVGYNF